MSNRNTYIPTREADLITWSNNFNARINGDPGLYGLTDVQANAYDVLHTAWVAAYQTANENSTRTPSAITTKNDAKEALIDGPGGIRQLVAIIQAFPDTTNTQRTDLGITIRNNEPTPVPVPDSIPVIEFTSVNGNRVNIRVHDNEAAGRGKPEGVTGVYVYSYVGEDSPTQINDWKFEGSSGKTELAIEFPASVQPSTKVWVCAAWVNGKFQTGEATPAVFTYTNHGSVQQAA